MRNTVLPKSLVDLYVNLHSQLVCCDPLGLSRSKSIQRDIETMKSRVNAEGFSFLTKSLPKLGKALDHALVRGTFALPREFAACGSRSKKGSIPAFMQEYFKALFDPDTGLLLETAPAGAVKHLRQVLFFAYKLEVPYSESSERTVVDAFVETEKELECLDIQDTDPLLDLCSRITGVVFDGFDHKDILPRHGPGAVATGEKLEDKWVFTRKYSAIHQVYPYYDYYIVGKGREIADRLDWYKSLQRHESGIAKVVLVPKDSRGPRLISAEPLEYQWIQQGLGRKFMAWLERGSPYGDPLPPRRINFTRQEINQELALHSSSSGEFATLDLESASDRVSLALVKGVFRRTPFLLRALEAIRTTGTTLPDGSVLPLRKFAPMGSALCFPVEAYVFWVVIVSAVSLARLAPLSEAGRKVYVYGDDIIIPVEWASTAIDALESVGLRVNRSKSCLSGYFRESCGMDAFKGERVTPVRVRKLWTGQPSDGTAFAAYVALANHLANEGYLAASDFTWDLIQSTYGYVPYGTSESAFPCKVVPFPQEAETMNLFSGFKWKWNKRYQRLEFSVLRVLPGTKDSKLDSWTRLLRNQVVPQKELDPSVVVVPRSTRIKRGWMAVS
jgi:hypothetical protein